MVIDPVLDRLLAGLDPSEFALRDWVVPQLDASMVDYIAAADYGMDVDQHRYAIEELVQFRRLPAELSGYPQEVLALTRWSIVDDDRLDPADARRSHLIRLFCCLVLVRATTYDGDPVNSLTPLVDSAIRLGPAAQEAAARSLAWCRRHEPGDWRDDPNSRPILTLALILLSAILPVGRTPDLLPGLIAVFADELSAVLAEENLAWSPQPVRALLKLTAMGESRRMWVALAGRHLVDAPAPLAVLGQAIRGELAADAAELRALLVAD